MFGFEKLEVWQFAVQFADRTYEITAHFPTDERFGLTNQLRRESVSISAHVAEGSGRGSSKGFSQFVEIAYGSLMETVSHWQIAYAQKFVTEPEFTEMYRRAEQLGKMLSGLRSSLHA